MLRIHHLTTRKMKAMGLEWDGDHYISAPGLSRAHYVRTAREATQFVEGYEACWDARPVPGPAVLTVLRSEPAAGVPSAANLRLTWSELDRAGIYVGANV